MKDELGWADFMVKSDRAIRRHWTLVCCAFAFCWWHGALQARERANRQHHPGRRKKTSQFKALAAPAACDARLADPGALAGVLLGALNSGHGINLYLRL